MAPEPEATESLASAMLLTMRDLTNEVRGLRDDLKEHNKKSSVSAITRRLDDHIAQEEVLIGELEALTEAVHMLLANFNLIGMGAGMLQRLMGRRQQGPPGPPMHR